jgi:hypothetical protein
MASRAASETGQLVFQPLHPQMAPTARRAEDECAPTVHSAFSLSYVLLIFTCGVVWLVRPCAADRTPLRLWWTLPRYGPCDNLLPQLTHPLTRGSYRRDIAPGRVKTEDHIYTQLQVALYPEMRF